VKLSSYAAWWIRAYILRFILNNWRLVKLGTTQAQRKLFFNLNKEKAKLSPSSSFSRVARSSRLSRAFRGAAGAGRFRFDVCFKRAISSY
jgi:DNA-directed RNA polymerase sigma subunit (sigma70/sigma32)